MEILDRGEIKSVDDIPHSPHFVACFAWAKICEAHHFGEDWDGPTLDEYANKICKELGAIGEVNVPGIVRATCNFAGTFLSNLGRPDTFDCRNLLYCLDFSDDRR